MDHQRFKQVATDGTTLYLAGFGVMAELVGPGTAGARWNDYLSVGNVKVGVRYTEVATANITTRYFHTDHLGSISVITNEAGAIVERLSYDAWGKRRFPNGADDTAGSIESETTRGFTNHEQLDVVGLVHMNGRVYDPMIGRMISPDPIVPDALNAQAWNRYAYVGNNPLTFTDPTGHSWLSSFFRTIFTIVAAFVLAPIVAAVVAATSIAAVVGAGVAKAIAAGITGSIVSAVSTGLSGGNLGQMLRAGAIAGLTAFAFNIAGGMTNAVAGHSFDADHVTPKFGSSAHVFNIASHSAIGCVSSAASGGRCQDGALSGAVGSFATPLVSDVFSGNPVAGALASGAVGGLASVAGGGKFENGAVTAAFGYLFNNEMHELAKRGIGLTDKMFEEAGWKLRGKEVSFVDADGVRGRVDRLYQDPRTGKYLAVEVKYGEYSDWTKNQRRYMQNLDKARITFVGTNAFRAGVLGPVNSSTWGGAMAVGHGGSAIESTARARGLSGRALFGGGAGVGFRSANE